MKQRRYLATLAVTALIAATSMLAALHASAAPVRGEVDWTAVEEALGKSGQLQPGDVFRVGMPRTDLNVAVRGVPVAPAFALGSYAAFKDLGDETMVMGDLVLLDEEVNPVMAGLFAGGISVTALHNHLNQVSPHVMRGPRPPAWTLGLRIKTPFSGNGQLAKRPMASGFVASGTSSPKPHPLP